jgi:hypothetical protein
VNRFWLFGAAICPNQLCAWFKIGLGALGGVASGKLALLSGADMENASAAAPELQLTADIGGGAEGPAAATLPEFWLMNPCRNPNPGELPAPGIAGLVLGVNRLASELAFPTELEAGRDAPKAENAGKAGLNGDSEDCMLKLPEDGWLP